MAEKHLEHIFDEGSCNNSGYWSPELRRAEVRSHVFKIRFGNSKPF